MAIRPYSERRAQTEILFRKAEGQKTSATFEGKSEDSDADYKPILKIRLTPEFASWKKTWDQYVRLADSLEPSARDVQTAETKIYIFYCVSTTRNPFHK